MMKGIYIILISLFINNNLLFCDEDIKAEVVDDDFKRQFQGGWVREDFLDFDRTGDKLRRKEK